MARDLGELNREEYAHYKDDVKKEGKPFFPFAIFHDTVMSLVVVVIIVALAAIWYFDADGVEPGILGPWYTEPADPGTTNFIPRPDWYFYFLFYLLRIFEWPETVFIATVGIPTICLILLIGLPFYDRRRERRPLAPSGGDGRGRPHDPLDGRPHLEGRDGEGGARLRARRCSCRTWAEEQGFADNAEAVKGAELFAQSGLSELPHLPRPGRRKPRRARPLRDRADERRCVLRPVPHESGGVRQHRDGLVRVPRAGEPRRARRVPRGVEGQGASRTSAAEASLAAHGRASAFV